MPVSTFPDRASAGATVRLDQVRRVFGTHAAVDGVTLAVDRGEVLCLVGASGSGKSTLLRLIAGLERATSGVVEIDGAIVDGPAVSVPPEARRVGMVFQDFALFPHLTVADNVGFGLTGQARADRHRLVAGLLERVGLTRYATRYPHMLSGGERQRVALARALAPQPRLLLMDEPFSSLDGRLREQLRDETATLLRDAGTTAVIVTHDPAEALRLGDRVALMDRGRIVQCDVPATMFLRPVSAFAARFFGEVNELPGTCVAGVVETPLGPLPAPSALPDRTGVAVCIRPPDLHLVDAPAGLPGRVIRSTFREGWHDLAVELEWGGRAAQLSVHTRSPVPPRAGAIVHLDADLARVVVTAGDAA